MYNGIVNCKWHKTLKKKGNITKYKILNTKEFYKKKCVFHMSTVIFLEGCVQK